MKLTKIIEFKNNKQLTFNNNIIDYIPKYVYIPLFDNNEKYVSTLQINDYVQMGQVVAKGNKTNTLIHSSISGIVTSIDKKMYINSGLKINCIEIKNDYNNNSIIENKNCIYEKNEIIKRIENSGIIGMGGAGFPTAQKYKNKTFSTLIVNGCECEPFITCDYRLMLEQTIKLINGIHYVLKAIEGKIAYICIKKNYHDLFATLNHYIDDKIKIILVDNKYPVGYERYLVEKITKKKYDKLPSEVDCVVNNVSTIISIHDAVKYNTPLISRVVTVTGNCLDKQINIRLKLGTNIEEIFENVCIIKHKYYDKHLIAGGPMTGKCIPESNLIVTKTLNSVIINPYLRRQNEVVPCIGCGKCSSVCPMKLTPTQILFYYNKNEKEELKKLKANLCIKCGLCSYICPSRIDLTIITSKASDLIKRG